MDEIRLRAIQIAADLGGHASVESLIRAAREVENYIRGGQIAGAGVGGILGGVQKTQPMSSFAGKANIHDA